MKIIRKFVQWLAKVTGAVITVEKTVEVEKIVEKIVYRSLEDSQVDGDIEVDGDLIVNGYINATGDVTCKNSRKEDIQNG